MRFIIILIPLFFLGICSKAQTLLFTVPLNQGSTIYTDDLRNLYVYSESNLRKYLPDGILQYEISPKRYGQLSHFDATDPLRPIMFYKDQGLMVMLDNTLSEQGSAIDLFALDIGQAWAMCQSSDSHFWVYDLDNFELLRLDRNLSKVVRSGNLFQVCGQAIIPTWMMERNSKLYVADPEKGIYMFDLFGTYIGMIPQKGVNRFQVIENEIYFFNEGRIHIFFNAMISEAEIFQYPDEINLVLISKDYRFLLKESSVDVYRN